MLFKKTFVFCLVLLFSFTSKAQSAGFCGVSGGAVSKDSVFKAKTIDTEPGIRILNFKMSYVNNGCKTMLNGNANVLSETMREVLQKSKSGETFTFEQIRALGKNGNMIGLPPIVIKVK